MPAPDIEAHAVTHLAQHPADRTCIRVVQGKGGYGRYCQLSPELYEQLRLYWRMCRHHARAED